MTDDTLIAKLEQHRESARRCFDYHAQRERLGVVGEEPQPTISELISSLGEVLQAHPVFGRARHIFFAMKSFTLHPYHVPYGLLRKMLDSDAPSAVAWLHRLFEINHARLRMLAALHGLKVQQPVTLSNGVRLLPFGSGPDSPNLRALERRYQEDPRSMSDFASWMPPTIAVFDMGAVPGSDDHKVGEAAYQHAHNALRDTARAFTLTDRGAPVMGVSWTEFVEPELMLAEFGMMWMSPRFEGSLSHTQLDVDDEALAWAERYLGLEQKLRLVVDLALDRLNLARRRISPGDKAIDGGICLEALLGDDGQQEITYKLRLRAALLIGTTLTEREEIRKAVGKFYDLRSKVVHGRARRLTDISQDTQCAARGLEICTQVVRAVVQRGAQPDFARWELAGGSPDDVGLATPGLEHTE